MKNFNGFEPKSLFFALAASCASGCRPSSYAVKTGGEIVIRRLDIRRFGLSNDEIFVKSRSWRRTFDAKPS